MRTHDSTPVRFAAMLLLLPMHRSIISSSTSHPWEPLQATDAGTLHSERVRQRLRARMESALAQPPLVQKKIS